MDDEVLQRHLEALAHGLRGPGRLTADIFTQIDSAFHKDRGEIQDRFETGRITALFAAKALSDLHDLLIQVLCDFVTEHLYRAPNPTEAEHIAIVATGGYGRRQLAPQSDIDLLFLRPYKQTSWTESVIEFVLHKLWDMGLKVGHATRSIDECIRLAGNDITVRTALLDARFVWGDAALADRLRRDFRTKVAAVTGLYFVSAKLAERDERHIRQGASRYLVEPNIKEGKGGLRDLHTLYWVGKYLYAVDDAAALIHHNVFTREEFGAFREAEGFLWSVRFHLHYVAHRPGDRLTFDVQPEIARRCGFGDKNARRAVEAFMQRYFLVAKDVGNLTRIFCAALEEQNKKTRPRFPQLLPALAKLRARTSDFLVENGRLNCRQNAFRRDPANLLRIFSEADARGLDIHPAAMRSVTRSLDLITDGVRNDAEANRLFLSILTSRRDPEHALRLLNESGVFGTFVPEFGRVVARMQFNMYHHYTVDEHLIRAVGNVAAIERGECKNEHPLATELIKRIDRREILYAATLLHDIAKGLPGDHSDAGAQIAERLCSRWRMSAEDTAAVAWLVRHHLLMSDTAQRRDISDPKTVKDFASTVRSPEMLRLLLVLTVADIRAVGPGVWNGWKGQLLRELYVEAEARLSGAIAPLRTTSVAEAKQALSQRLADFGPAEREQTLLRHSDNYWLAFDAGQHERHARLLKLAEASNDLLVFHAENNEFQTVTQVVVVTPDHAGLFSELAGAITVSGGSIVDAKIFTTADGLALDIFSVQDAESGPFGDAARMERLRRNIDKTLRGELSPRVALVKSARKAKTSFEVRPRVQFDNDASARATVIEIQAHDRPGLLYDITRAIFEARLFISSSIVATYGERAVDVFYVRDAFGHKITHPERLAAIQAHLLKRLAADTLEAATT